MQALLFTIHILAVLSLIGVILLQRSEGGALGLGSSSFMSGRAKADFLTRATMILAAVFFTTSLGLTILAGFGSAQRLQLQGVTSPITPAGAPIQPATPAVPPSPAGNLLDQLQKLEQEKSNRVQVQSRQTLGAPLQAPAPSTSVAPAGTAPVAPVIPAAPVAPNADGVIPSAPLPSSVPEATKPASSAPSEPTPAAPVPSAPPSQN